MKPLVVRCLEVRCGTVGCTGSRPCALPSVAGVHWTPSLCPATVSLTPSAMVFVTDSNRPNRFGDLLQPPVATRKNVSVFTANKLGWNQLA